MIETLPLVGKIIYYLLFVLFLFLYARHKYEYGKNKNGKNVKFGFIALTIFAILFGIYGVICGPPGESIGDRHNYAVRFEVDRYEESVKEASPGLYFIESIVHIFSNNSSILFFVISVIYFCINIYCYKNLKDATPLYLLLFFLSTLGLFGFYGLKQAMALAFVNLSLTEYFQRKRVLAIAFLIVAILFHEATWIVIPFFVLAKYCKGSKIRQIIIYACTIMITIFFPQISKFFLSIFGYIPGMNEQLSSYVDETGSVMVDMNFFTIIKGVPYYLITIIAIACREKLKDKVDNYDFLLALSVFCSIFSVLSMYMYWMFRFALYCYVPCFILASQLALYLQERDTRIFKLLVAGILLILMIKVLTQYYFIYGGII